MALTNNRAEVETLMQRAEADALFAAARVYRNAMMKALRGGYTTGAYAHGFDGVAGSVAVGTPQRDAEGGFIVVGTNVEYAKYWELGHHNLFMWDGRGSGPPFVRVEKWRPTLEQEAPAILDKYAAVYKALMKQARPKKGARATRGRTPRRRR
jgi:hypothetical protein